MKTFFDCFYFYAEYERTVLFPYNAQVDTAAKFVQDIIDKAKTEAAKKLNSEQIVSFSADIFFVFVFVLWHCYGNLKQYRTIGDKILKS